MEDASGGHLGRIWKHLEAPRRGTQEAPRKHPEGPRPPRRLQGVCDSKSSTPALKCRRSPEMIILHWVFELVRSPSTGNWNRKCSPAAAHGELSHAP